MRQAFNIAVVLLLGYLMADRALMRAQAGEIGTITCHRGAEHPGREFPVELSGYGQWSGGQSGRARLRWSRR
jgi:hypothetical protein